MPGKTRTQVGWPIVTLGDVVERINDRRDDPVSEGFERFVGVDDLDADDLRLRRRGLIKDGGLPPTFRYAFAAGSVLFPTRRPALRKCAIAPFSGVTGEKILVLQSRDSSKLDPVWIGPFPITRAHTNGTVTFSRPHGVLERRNIRQIKPI